MPLFTGRRLSHITERPSPCECWGTLRLGVVTIAHETRKSCLSSARWCLKLFTFAALSFLLFIYFLFISHFLAFLSDIISIHVRLVEVFLSGWLLWLNLFLVFVFKCAMLFIAVCKCMIAIDFHSLFRSLSSKCVRVCPRVSVCLRMFDICVYIIIL